MKKWSIIFFLYPLMAFGQKSVNHVSFVFFSLMASNSKDFQFSLQEALFESQISNLLIPHFSRQFWMSKALNLRRYVPPITNSYNNNPVKITIHFPKSEKQLKLKLPISYRYSFGETVSQRKTISQSIKPWQFHFTRASAQTLIPPLAAEKGLVTTVQWSSTC